MNDEGDPVALDVRVLHRRRRTSVELGATQANMQRYLSRIRDLAEASSVRDSVGEG